MTVTEPERSTQQRTPSAPAPPTPLPPGPGIELPESRSYRFKNKVLGPPLHTDQLEHERLGKPTALAVFASDALSSTAYATEEIMRVLVPVIGVPGLHLVCPADHLGHGRWSW